MKPPQKTVLKIFPPMSFLSGCISISYSVTDFLILPKVTGVVLSCAIVLWFGTCELNFHNWNANWLMKCEGQFRTSVLAPYTVLYVNFNLARDFLRFSEEFSLKISQNVSSNTEMSLRISIIFQQSHTKLQIIYFHENELPTFRKTW